MHIRGLMLDPVTNMPIVVLKDIASELVLPIWVGVFEANAIALELEKAPTPRPMTHDLLRHFVRGLGAQVTKVVVSDLRDDTFYATVWMRQAGEPITIDARPSTPSPSPCARTARSTLRKRVLGRARQNATEPAPQTSTPKSCAPGSRT